MTGTPNCFSKFRLETSWDGSNRHVDRRSMQILQPGSFPNDVATPDEPQAAVSIMETGAWHDGSGMSCNHRSSPCLPRSARQPIAEPTRRGNAGPPPPILQSSPPQGSGPLPSMCHAWLPTPGSLTRQSIAALPNIGDIPPFASSGPLPPPSQTPSCGSFDRELFQTASSITNVLDGLEDTWSQWAASMGSFPVAQEPGRQAATVSAPMESSRLNVSRRLLAEQNIKRPTRGGPDPRPCLPVSLTRDAMSNFPGHTQASHHSPAAVPTPSLGLPSAILSTRVGEHVTPESCQSRGVLPWTPQDTHDLKKRSTGLAVKRQQRLSCHKIPVSRCARGFSMRIAAALLQLAWTAWVCELRRAGLLRLTILQAASFLRPIIASWRRHVREILPLRLVVEFRPLRRAFEVWRKCTSLAAFSKVSDAAPAQPPAPTFKIGNVVAHTSPEAVGSSWQEDAKDSCHSSRTMMHQSKGYHKIETRASQLTLRRRGSALHTMLRKGAAGRGCRCCWRLWRREARLQSRLRGAGKEIARLHAHATTRRCLHVWRVAVVASASATAHKRTVSIDGEITKDSNAWTVPLRRTSDRAMGALEAFVQARLGLAGLHTILRVWAASVRDARVAAHVADLERSVERHSAMRRHAVWLLANAAPGTPSEALMVHTTHSAKSSGLSAEEY